MFVFHADGPGICRILALCFEPSDLPVLQQGQLGDATCCREGDGESTLCSFILFPGKSREQKHHECRNVPARGGEGAGLLVESFNPYRDIGGHSKVSIFSTNRPCNLHEGMKSPQGQHLAPSKVPVATTDVAKGICFLPVQLHDYFQA